MSQDKTDEELMGLPKQTLIQYARAFQRGLEWWKTAYQLEVGEERYEKFLTYTRFGYGLDEPIKEKAVDTKTGEIAFLDNLLPKDREQFTELSDEEFQKLIGLKPWRRVDALRHMRNGTYPKEEIDE